MLPVIIQAMTERDVHAQLGALVSEYGALVTRIGQLRACLEAQGGMLSALGQALKSDSAVDVDAEDFILAHRQQPADTVSPDLPKVRGLLSELKETRRRKAELTQRISAQGLGHIVKE